MFALLLIAASAVHSLEIIDRVELIEVNHLYDDRAQLVLDQLIFWEWRPEESAYRVVAWRLIRFPTMRPERAPCGGYRATWREEGLLRRVFAASFRETWTHYDPELYDRRFLPQCRRRELTKPCAGRKGALGDEVNR